PAAAPTRFAKVRDRRQCSPLSSLGFCLKPLFLTRKNDQEAISAERALPVELALVTSSEYCGKEFPVTEQSDRDESSQVKSLFRDQPWTFSPRFNIKGRYQISRPTRRFSHDTILQHRRSNHR